MESICTTEEHRHFREDVMKWFKVHLWCIEHIKNTIHLSHTTCH